MPSLSQICNCISASNSSATGFASPLINACQLLRSPIDHAPLPSATIESSFDSAWEIMYQNSVAS